MNGYPKEYILMQILKTKAKLQKEKNTIQYHILQARLKKLKKIYRDMQMVYF